MLTPSEPSPGFGWMEQMGWMVCWRWTCRVGWVGLDVECVGFGCLYICQFGWQFPSHANCGFLEDWGDFHQPPKKHKQIIKLTVVVKLGITPNLMAIQNFPPELSFCFLRLAFLGGVTRSGWCLHMQTPHPDRRAWSTQSKHACQIGQSDHIMLESNLFETVWKPPI